jgi:hypothetical protein
MQENKHLIFFIQYCQNKKNSQESIGFIPFNFWKNVSCNQGIYFTDFINVDSQNLPKIKLKREDVIKFVNSDIYSFEEKLIMIFAWGGMKIENAILFFGNYLNYGNALKEVLCNNDLNREEKFNRINKLKLNNCKIAYFTKLIFFFTANSKKPGYILDQWTAKSVNLLLNSKIVSLDAQGYVNKNDKSVYELYCNFIELLFEKIKSNNIDILNPIIIEEHLFDVGGKKQSIGVWRKYVKDNYR